MNTQNNNKQVFLSLELVKESTPLQQGVSVAAVSAIIIGMLGMLTGNQETAWFVANCALGFFAWMNTVIGFFCRKRWLRYVGQSVFLFIALSALLWFVASMFSELQLMDLREYRTMFVATVVFYICSILIASIIREVAKLMRIY